MKNYAKENSTINGGWATNSEVECQVKMPGSGSEPRSLGTQVANRHRGKKRPAHFTHHRQTLNTFERFQESFHACFRSDWRKQFISDCLGSLTDYQRLVDFMVRYTAFNSVFAGGVASLAGEIHVRQDLFRDQDEPEFHLADRSAEIASRVFVAAEDEFDARRLGKRITHRHLAQFLLRELLKIGAVTNETTPNHREADQNDRRLERKVREAYQAKAGEKDQRLFHAMGFHLASEIFADQEFNAIDEFLKSKFPAIVQRLRATTEPDGFNAYSWIGAHCTVEAEHADSAADAIRLAFRYYVGGEEIGKLSRAALRGVADFARIQEAHFRLAAVRTHGTAASLGFILPLNWPFNA